MEGKYVQTRLYKPAEDISGLTVLPGAVIAEATQRQDGGWQYALHRNPGECVGNLVLGTEDATALLSLARGLDYIHVVKNNPAGITVDILVDPDRKQQVVGIRLS